MVFNNEKLENIVYVNSLFSENDPILVRKEFKVILQYCTAQPVLRLKITLLGE